MLRGFSAVFYREMQMLISRIGGLGYLFSGLLFPMIYLLAFGWGLGDRVAVAGGYFAYLAKGMLAITVMMNGFQQTALSVSAARFYYRNFSTLRLSPISDSALVFGIALAGTVRALAAAAVIFLTARLFWGLEILSLPGLGGLVLTAFAFAAFGVAVGLSIKGQEQFSIIINFFITPMTFFCGSFFPVANLPDVVRQVVQYMPLSLTNQLLRADSFGETSLWETGLLLVITLCTYAYGVYRVHDYSEF
ncbi:putative ABC transporter permease protein [Selenomonas ruminantium subsp. lactilytica TAM6421]|uniref:Transport permease protein n=1 Tax=Selenomonas ruminantium subsp. lactilytica (strain NBRC 103574 / TAM6421) TaxID=927704 RepID=I0GQ47_SELRL|nr:ABC transporter permease [Selenomonas ruminantium]BAL82884.1 putative ABC transporter permease protein [Selenomonas ruminantium subsp. lactilytica TAM6421]